MGPTECYSFPGALVEPDRRSSAYALAPGTLVGNNEVLRKIATGGMAEIYLVRVRGVAGFEKVMVLKRILPRFAENPRFVGMFLNEARLAGTLRHPNIADVMDVGEAEGTYFFTREYVHGQNLFAIISAARDRHELIPLPIALAIVHALANGLHHAHEKRGNDGRPLGLVHRDVSSTNIMVSYDGAVKLLDFGIARETGAHTTQTGPLENKVPYMSPEQCRSLPLDRRSDLFSLGVIMFELTVGRRPFRGLTQYDIMEQIVRRSAPRPSELLHGYPPDLEAIVMRLLDPVPADRYPNGDQVLHDLDLFITNHEQWISSRAIGRYMQQLFADQVAAWEHAHQEGVPFAEHIASTMISQPVRVDEPPPEEPKTSPELPNRVFGPIRPVQTSTQVPVVTPSTAAALEASLLAACEPQLAEPPELETTLQDELTAVASVESAVIEPLPPVMTAPTFVEPHHAATETTLPSPPPVVAAPAARATTDVDEVESEPPIGEMVATEAPAIAAPTATPAVEEETEPPIVEVIEANAVIEEPAPPPATPPTSEALEPEVSIEELAPAAVEDVVVESEPPIVEVIEAIAVIEEPAPPPAPPPTSEALEPEVSFEEPAESLEPEVSIEELAPAAVEDVVVESEPPIVEVIVASSEPASDPLLLSAIIEELAPAATPPEPSEPEPKPVSVEQPSERSVLWPDGLPIIEDKAPPAAPVSVEPSNERSALWDDNWQPPSERSVLWDPEPSAPVVPADTTPAPETSSEPDEAQPEDEQRPESVSHPARRPRSGVLFALFIFLLLAAAGVFAFQWLQDDVEHVGGSGADTGQGSNHR
jgi:serine/threonine protein kinase